jgi:hypothetical protein
MGISTEIPIMFKRVTEIFKTSTTVHLLPPAPPQTLLAHPLAAVIPEAPQQVIDEMAIDIGLNGLLFEILLYESKILDGRARYLACGKAGVEPRYVLYTGENALDEVIARNALRKHLRRWQAAMSAARLANLPVGANQFREEKGWTIEQASGVFGVNEKSVVRAKAILANGDQELIARVDAGEIAISAAYNQLHGPTPLTEQERDQDTDNPKPESADAAVIVSTADAPGDDELIAEPEIIDGLSHAERGQLLTLRVMINANPALRRALTTASERVLLRVVASLRGEVDQTSEHA